MSPNRRLRPLILGLHLPISCQPAATLLGTCPRNPAVDEVERHGKRPVAGLSGCLRPRPRLWRPRFPTPSSSAATRSRPQHHHPQQGRQCRQLPRTAETAVRVHRRVLYGLHRALHGDRREALACRHHGRETAAAVGCGNRSLHRARKAFDCAAASRPRLSASCCSNASTPKIPAIVGLPSVGIARRCAGAAPFSAPLGRFRVSPEPYSSFPSARSTHR